MKALENIDLELTKQFQVLKDAVEKIEFQKVCEFTLAQTDSIPWPDLKHPGIYLLEIKNNGELQDFQEWIKKFRNEWEDEKYLRQFTPNLKKVRVNSHTQLKEWVPIYIGKSKNIKSRIHGHIFKDLNKSTFALKLMAREHLQKDCFRLSKIYISVKNYDAIVPKIEGQLRNKINPIIGKQ